MCTAVHLYTLPMKCTSVCCSYGVCIYVLFLWSVHMCTVPMECASVYSSYEVYICVLFL